MVTDECVRSNKVYEWERSLSYGKKLSPMEVVDLVTDISKEYYIDPPMITFYSSKNEHLDPCYDNEVHTIFLPKYALFTSVIVHECAHAIRDTLGSAVSYGHSPEFVRLLCELFHKHLYNNSQIVTLDFLINSARKSGVEVADSWFSIGSAAFYLGVEEYAIEMLCDQEY